MDRGLCGERDSCGKNVSSRKRDSDYGRAERYNYCCKHGGDDQTARNHIWNFQMWFRADNHQPVWNMLNTIWDSLNELACSDDEQHGEDKEEDQDDTELGKLSDDEEPGLAMTTMSKTVQHCIESVGQNQMRLHELTQPGWGDAANYICERDMKYGTARLNVPAVVKLQIDTTAATPSPMTFGGYMLTLDIIWQ